ncbi:hypothetical protein [Roseivivax marinus]|jgi:hypothetical protein|uniref:hypothetical protein n=1 Tax=Roseivivax marinus TaxID=1379903 RepID=UPI00273E60B3|nr:hypothetical protein [Roseivivax marinus]
MTDTARRLYLQAYRRWLDADAAWQRALTEAERLVPGIATRHAWPLGHGGSRVRGAYERRARAIDVLHRARLIYLTSERHARGGRARTLFLLRMPDAG